MNKANENIERFKAYVEKNFNIAKIIDHYTLSDEYDEDIDVSYHFEVELLTGEIATIAFDYSDKKDQYSLWSLGVSNPFHTEWFFHHDLTKEGDSFITS